MRAVRRIGILERMKAVLAGIKAGATYHYTIGGDRVYSGLRVWTECGGYPAVMVYWGSDHRGVEYLTDGRVMIYPTVVVAAYVDGEDGDFVKKMLKVLSDVELAVESDLSSNAAGSLGVLVDWGRIGAVVTDEGELGLEGLAGFRMEVNICLTGEWGDF